MNLKPLGDHVIVRRDEAESKSKGGILLPDTAQKRGTIGKVLAVGPGERIKDGTARIPVCVSEGDRVLFTTYAGNEIDWNGEKLLVLSERDIIAIETVS